MKTCKALSDEGTKVNVTLCFSPAQALLAAKAGATFISPFVGRLDDIGYDGMQLIDDVVQIYRNYDNLRTEVLVASIAQRCRIWSKSARLGADVATLPPDVIKQAVQPSADRQGSRRLPQGLGSHRPIHPGLGGRRPLAGRGHAAAWLAG